MNRPESRAGRDPGEGRAKVGRYSSVARLMTLVGLLAVGMVAGQVMVSRMPRSGPAAIALVACATLGADRAIFRAGHRAFWVGFTVTCWFLFATSLIWCEWMHHLLVEFGPSMIGAREAFQREAAAIARMRFRGFAVADPARPNELHLLASAVSETGVFLAMIACIASHEGFFVVGVTSVAKRLVLRPKT